MREIRGIIEDIKFDAVLSNAIELELVPRTQFTITLYGMPAEQFHGLAGKKARMFVEEDSDSRCPDEKAEGWPGTFRLTARDLVELPCDLLNDPAFRKLHGMVPCEPPTEGKRTPRPCALDDAAAAQRLYPVPCEPRINIPDPAAWLEQKLDESMRWLADTDTAAPASLDRPAPDNPDAYGFPKDLLEPESAPEPDTWRTRPPLL